MGFDKKNGDRAEMEGCQNIDIDIDIDIDVDIDIDIDISIYWYWYWYWCLQAILWVFDKKNGDRV